MTDAIATTGLTKNYGRKTALNDCTLTVPTGRIVGLVGPNGAGKSTLLQLACGLLRPTTGSIEVLGERPGNGPEHTARIGFVAQDTPTYAHLSIAEHLRLGRALNRGWDDALARERIEQLGLDPAQRAGKLSGGQRSQLALTLAVAKRPELLLLDEPVAALDPLARREFLQGLMEHTAEHGTSLVLSSHLIADLERTCDYLVVLVDSRIRLAGDVEELLAQHHRVTGARREASSLPSGHEVVYQSHTGKQSTMIVRSSAPIEDPWWTVEQLSMEDLVLAYMTEAGRIAPARVLEGHR
ncbi:ABC transporter ATP-binding protein [Actinoplanes sp. NBRC 103695]|uniref:ABC transporter ATP-binding protein n=1 Tax=Actinoplanes sp. NBRC 103695 TaxID=3032202 RepID=UPI0024A065BC|nr:ABC transporter ATP-binding protein [Actinoplanes sp. NBRC 103695]GLY97053.1 ABC transporter ATP-binding protein [Actinoplanes sp. NBRC 103695]